MEEMNKTKIYFVKDMDGLSTLQLNQQQLDDVVKRIQDRYHDTELAPQVFGDVETCLAVGSMKIVGVIYRESPKCFK